MIRGALDWLEDRTGLESALKHFLYEDIPDSSGWHQVFGSVAMFAFLVQAVTGILLAFNYAPTPGEAYDSLRYIMTQVTAGRLIRGAHHWGASLMIIVPCYGARIRSRAKPPGSRACCCCCSPWRSD
jgi:quinol-cytochrome oxidoreductase complex cytochrome b subunit